MANAPMAKDETTMLADIHYPLNQHCELLCPLAKLENPHQRPHFHQVCVRPLIFRHSLDTSRLDAEFGDRSLDLGIWGVACNEGFARDSRSIGGVSWESPSFLRVCSLRRVAAHFVVILKEAHFRRWMKYAGYFWVA